MENSKQSTSYSCPSCGAAMIFDPQTGKLGCEYCGTEVSIEELDHQTHANEDYISSSQIPAQTENFMQYHCQTCGAEILTDANTTATICSFCGTPGLIQSRLSGAECPSQVLPFKIDRTQMTDIFKKWTKRGLFTPSEFTSSSTIEKITGMYVPYWLFDYHTDTSLSAHCTRKRSERRGDTQYTYTDHFDVYREIEADFEKIPTDASIQLDDSMMDKLEPFHYQDMKPFDMRYLSGYQSEKYNLTAEQLQDRAKKRIQEYTKSIAKETITGYSSTNIINTNIHITEKSTEYVLLPTWLLNYRYHNKNYIIAINGQTGKLVGDLPISKAKVLKWYFIIMLIVFIIAALIGGI